MKKVISLILAFALCLGLWACGNDNGEVTTPSEVDPSITEGTEETTEATEEITDPTEDTTDPTEEMTDPTEETTDSTEAPTAASTEAPTAAPTEAPTAAPTEAPTEPAQCSHNWKEATCTAPKTCKDCGVTEGSAKDHIWADATCDAPKTCESCGATEGTANGHDYIDGTCSVCGGAQENYKALTSGRWVAEQVVGECLYSITLSFADLHLSCGYGDDINTLYPDFRDELLQHYEQTQTGLTVVDGIYYYTGRGDGGNITYVVNGNDIEVNCEDYMFLKLTRIAGDRLVLLEGVVLNNSTEIILTWCE